MDDMRLAIQMYAETISSAVPFSIVFALGNLIVDTFLRVAFGGKLLFGRGGYNGR